MKIASASAVVFVLLAGPAAADKKVDDAVAKAAEQLRKGKPEDALKTMQKLVSGTPTPEAHLALGRFLEKLGNLDEAEAALAQAEQAAAAAPDPLKAQTLAARAEMELKRGAAKGALERARQATQLDPSAENLAILAHAQARSYDLAGGLITADKAVQVGVNSAAAHSARGFVLLTQGRGEEATVAYRKALELDPQLEGARVGLARALLAQGKAAEAVAEARRVTEADDKAAEAFAVLGASLLAQNVDNWGGAIEQAQQGAFLDPKSPLVQTIVGDLFSAAGNYDQATAAYRKALASDPAYSAASAGLIQMQVRKGDLDGALAAAQTLVAATPQSGAAQLELGRILARKSEWEAALEPLEKATRLAASEAEAFALLGTAYQYTGNTAAAEEAYQQAVKLDPKNPEYLTTYGLLQGMVGSHAEGAQSLQKVLATAEGQKSVAAWANAGWVYSRMRPPKIEEALAAYQKALALDPKNPQVHLGMGWANYYAQAWDAGIAAFRKAVELEPKLAAEAWNGIAWCLYFKKDMTSALDAADKAQSAGRNMDRLRGEIDKYQKRLAAGQRAEVAAAPEQIEEGPDLNALNKALQSKNPGVRRGAAVELRKAGRDAVPYLTYALADPVVAVRLAAVRSLMALGSAAREALPYLRNAAAAQFDIPVTATPAELQQMVEEEDYKKVVKEAIQKIQGN